MLYVTESALSAIARVALPSTSVTARFFLKEGAVVYTTLAAIMGCPVNGPGDAKEADIGVAGGKESALLIKKGEIIRSIPQKDVVKVLIEEIEKF